MDNHNDSLALSSPPPRKIANAIFCIFLISTLSIYIFKKLIYVTPTPWAGFIFFCVIFSWLGLSLYFNLVRRDFFLIKRNGISNPEKNTFSSDQILKVAVLDAPTYLSLEWNLALWGLAGHRISFVTSLGTIHFGRGLSTQRAEQIVDQVRQFCRHP